MIKQPFFSIVIPTYNRAKYLERTIKSIVRQSYINYEIIVSDNASIDNTESIVKDFKNKRIIYSRNRQNIGFARNFYKVVKMASGKYILVLGDDDCLLYKDILNKIHHLLSQKDIGYLRLRYLFYQHDNEQKLFETSLLLKQPLRIKKTAGNFKIIKYIYESHFGFIPGVIFKNDKTIKIQELENSNNNILQFEYFWFKFIYPAVKKYGGGIDNKNIIISRWSVYNMGKPHFYDVVDNKIYMEKGWSLFWPFLTTAERQQWVEEQTNMLIPILPSIKFYSSNKNLYLHIKRSFQLNKKIKYKISFYFCALIAFLMPRFIWRFLRKIFFRLNRVADVSINESYHKLLKELA